MTQMFLERNLNPPVTKPVAVERVKEGGWCMEMHRVNWLGSMLSVDGASMVCRFEASDAESIRVALRQLGLDTSRLWTGTVHDGPGDAEANVVVEREFTEPVDIDALQAKENAHQWCLDTHDVTFVRTFESADRKRMLCLYHAPDAEAVRRSQREADMPFTRIWSFTGIDASDFTG